MTTRKALLYLLMATFILIVPACSDDDDDPTTPPTPTYDDPQLEAFAVQGVALVQEIVGVLPDALSGQLTGKDTTSPTWDEADQVWRWGRENDSHANPADTWELGYQFALTFLQEEVPQMTPEGADNIKMEVVFYFYRNQFTDEANQFNLSFTMILTFETMTINPDYMEISGSGEGLLSGGGYTDGVPIGFYRDITMSSFLMIPTGECLSGGIDFDMDTQSFSVGFDGTTSAYWDYLKGPGNFVDGEFKISCP